jgi:TAP-like protein
MNSPTTSGASSNGCAEMPLPRPLDRLRRRIVAERQLTVRGATPIWTTRCAVTLDISAARAADHVARSSSRPGPRARRTRTRRSAYTLAGRWIECSGARAGHARRSAVRDRPRRHVVRRDRGNVPHRAHPGPSEAADAIAGGHNALLVGIADQLISHSPDPRDDAAHVLFEIVTCADDGGAFNDADREATNEPGIWEDVLLSWGFTCDAWAVSPLAGGRIADIGGDFPVLVTSGALDSVIPTSFVEELPQAVPEHNEVTVPAAGHSVAWVKPVPPKHHSRYIDQPTAALDTACVATLPAPFSSQDH